MGSRLFIIPAVLVVAAGVVGWVTFELIVNTTPAYAQQGDDPRVGLDCDDYGSQAEAQAALDADPSDPDVLDEDDGEACETFGYGDTDDGVDATEDRYDGEDGASGSGADAARRQLHTGLLRQARRPLLPLQRVAARVNRQDHGCMNGYSEDLRRRIVSTVGRGTSKVQAARTFAVRLSSVKRHANKAGRRESPAPKKSPRS